MLLFLAKSYLQVGANIISLTYSKCRNQSLQKHRACGDGQLIVIDEAIIASYVCYVFTLRKSHYHSCFQDRNSLCEILEAQE